GSGPAPRPNKNAPHACGGRAPGNNLPEAAMLNRSFTLFAPFRSCPRGNSMRSIVPSAALLRDRYAMVSHLRAQGFTIGTAGGRPQPGELYLVAEGETPPAAARTIIVGDGARRIIPSRDGNPARV